MRTVGWVVYGYSPERVAKREAMIKAGTPVPKIGRPKAISPAMGARDSAREWANRAEKQGYEITSIELGLS